MSRASARRQFPTIQLLAMTLLLAPLGASAAADGAPPGEAPAAVLLAEHGRAALPVVVGTNASPRVRAAAAELAEYLGRITGGTFQVVPGDGRTGIAVGLAADFPALKLDGMFDPADITRREEYLLRSHAAGLLVVGATDLAVADAVWGLLYRLGHRQFFPGPTWEVVPRSPTLRLKVDAVEKPDYLSRRIWYNWDSWPHNRALQEQWWSRNRTRGGFALNSGHAWETILDHHQELFAAHPEYLALVNGKRVRPKFCLSNPDLRKFLVGYFLDRLADDPAADSVSVDPSDGGGWCECGRCAALGSVSDQVVGLANEVAAAVRERFGEGRYVAFDAYNVHQEPPTLRVDPQVVVSVSTHFLQGSTPEALMAGWQRQGARLLGVREYYSVNTWDRDVPGTTRVNLGMLAKTVPDFHARGARFMSAESGDNWGPAGLSYYVASRLLWDVDEAARVPELVEDFLHRSFGPAKAPMARFYEAIDGRTRPFLSDDLLGRMYRCLDEASRLAAGDAAVLARIGDLTLYARYVELYRDYVASAEGPARAKAVEALIRHAYRMRDSGMVHSQALYQDLPRYAQGAVPEQFAWTVPEEQNAWKQNGPFTRDELARVVARGVAANELIDFEPVAFSRDLVPATPLDLPDVPNGWSGYLGKSNRIYTWVGDAPGTVALEVTAGVVPDSTYHGDWKLSLYPVQDVLGEPSDVATVTHRKEPWAVRLKTAARGLHYVEMHGRIDANAVRFAEGTAMTFHHGLDSPYRFVAGWSLYFYVPRGTKTVAGYSSGGEGQMLDGAGRVVHTFGRNGDYFNVPVPPGRDGQLWKFTETGGARRLMTVPPYLARNGRELLLPREVVERDAAPDHRGQ